jgi:thiol:disulfide interchange protein DsbA
MLWIRRIIFMLALAPLAFCQAADEAFKAGEHYDILPQAVRTANSGKIEINEVFSYGCGHCFNFQSELHPWVKKLPADVDFQSTPAVWGKNLELFARAYYAAKVLDVLDKVHMPIFDAIHVKKKSVKNQSDFEAIFVAEGVSKEKFSSAFNSFGTTSMVNQAKSRVRAYRVRGTPEVIVNGKYRVSTTKAGGFKGMLKVAEFLIEKERAAKAK